MRDVPTSDASPRVDSVPPLSSTSSTHESRRGLRRTIRRTILIALPSLIAVALHTTNSLDHKPPRVRTSLNEFVATHTIAIKPPPVPSALVDDAVREDSEPTTLEAQRARLFGLLRTELRLSEEQFVKVQAIFAASPVLGQGNPALSKHPITRDECRRIRKDAKLERADVAACQAPGMVAVFDPITGQTVNDAHLCIDEFEFPNIPCEYPVVHVRAHEAANICAAMGKRLCDAHEWEGACAGSFR